MHQLFTKHFAAILLILLSTGTMSSQNKFQLKIEAPAPDQITQKMGYSASIIFQRINEGKTTFPPECISGNGVEDILKLTRHVRLLIDTVKRTYSRITTSFGYQIRGIPVRIPENGITMQAVMNFNPNGVVESFHFAIDENIFNAILDEHTSEIDLSRRRIILDFIENFRTAYNRKDLPLICRMYSDDAMVLTGYIHTITRTEKNKSGYGMSTEKIEYNLYSKNEYLANLQNVFEKNRFVNLDFNNISILQHPVRKQIYGVTLLQAWRSEKYNDDGWLFIALEFIGKNEMLVHIRTWQPYMLNNLVLPREEIYQLGHFEF